MNSLTLSWLAENVQWISEISVRDVITADYVVNKSDECLWKCQNINKCPDVSGLWPSSVECPLWVAPWFQVLNVKFESCVSHPRVNFKWSENHHWDRAAGMSRVERWVAFPASSSVCSHRRVWSRGPVLTLRYVRWNWNALRRENKVNSC